MNPAIHSPQLINFTAGSSRKLNNLWMAHTVAALEAEPIHLIQTKYLQYIQKTPKRLPADTLCWVFI